MTWAEFQIRLFAFRRIEKSNWEKLRMLMYNNTIASHLDPKKIPKTIDKFMNLNGSEKPTITDHQKQLIEQIKKQYNERKSKD